MTSKDQSSGPLTVASTLSSRPDESQTPTVLDGRFRLVAPLGTRCSGVTYRAEDLELAEPVIVTRLPSVVVSTADRRERFAAETAALFKISHPGLHRLRSSGVMGHIPYLVWPQLIGISLEERVVNGALAAAEVLEVARQILGALDVAHKKGVTHLDIGPSQVHFVEDDSGRPRAVLTNLGVARLVLREERGQGPLITLTGEVVGAPEYMAPEQASGGEIDGRADLYSMASMLFELVTNQKLFDGDSSDQMLKHLYTAPPKIRDRAPSLKPGPELDAFFERALVKEPQGRFQTAAEMLGVLERFSPALEATLRSRESLLPVPGETSPSGGQVQDATPDSGRTGRPGRTIAVIAIVGVLCLAAAACAYLFLFAGGDADMRVIANVSPAADPPPLGGDLRPAPAGEVDDSHVAEPTEAPAPAPAQDTAPTTPDAGAPAAGSLWSDTDIDPFYVEAKATLDAGKALNQSTIKKLRRVAMTDDRDPRPFLILARHRVSLGHFSDALERYERAVKADTRARAEPTMLPDLIAMVKTRALALRATMAIRRIYGRDAIEAVDEALTTPDLSVEQARRLRICRRALQVTAP